MFNLSKRYTQLATAGLLGVTLFTASCAPGSDGLNMTPREAGRAAKAACELGGNVAGALLGHQFEDSGLGAAAGALLTGRSTGRLCEQYARARAAYQGHCDRDIRIDNRTGEVTRDNSKCEQRHGIPSGLR